MALKFNALTSQLDIVLDKANEIIYDPTGDTYITGDNTQDAISELDAALAALPSPIYYAGTWDASTNTPTLDDTDTGVEGALYRVNVAGTVDFGAGNISFDIGDSVVNNGTVWEKWDFTDQVLSVNSQTGAVVLDTDDVSDATATNKYFTNALAQAAITGGASTIVTTDLAFDRALASNGSGKVVVSATTATELGFVAGLTSSAQTQLNSKAPSASPTFTGTVTTPVTASRALVTGASSELAASATTATELSYLNGVTSAVQTQLDARSVKPTVAVVNSDTTLVADVVSLVDTSAARALTLPAVLANLILYIKDATGSSETNNITITPASGLIDGAASLVINSNYASVTLISDGTNFFSI